MFTPAEGEDDNHIGEWRTNNTAEDAPGLCLQHGAFQHHTSLLSYSQSSKDNFLRHPQTARPVKGSITNPYLDDL